MGKKIKVVELFAGVGGFRKDLQIGDYLIDDSPRNGAAAFNGKWIHFGSEEFTCWKDILNFLLP